MSKLDKAAYVYCHINKVNGKVYVGISTKPYKRWGTNGCGYKKLNDKGCFANAIDKYGWDNFEHYILEECTFEQAKELEKYYIKMFNSKAPNGYNLTEGGDGILGRKATPEEIKRMSERSKGRTSPNKGKKMSERTKRLISEKNKGRKWTEEQRAKILKARTGVKMSEQARKNMSEARKGIKFSKEHKKNLSLSHKGHPVCKECLDATCKPVSMFSKEGDYIMSFVSVSEANRFISKTNRISCIAEVCNGKRKTSCGYVWRWDSVWDV